MADEFAIYPFVIRCIFINLCKVLQNSVNYYATCGPVETKMAANYNYLTTILFIYITEIEMKQIRKTAIKI